MAATTVTTPVRKATELSNESPLPTPPRAMHDLIRNGRRGNSLTSHRDEDNADEAEAVGQILATKNNSDEGDEGVFGGGVSSSRTHRTRPEHYPSSPSDRAAAPAKSHTRSAQHQRSASAATNEQPRASKRDDYAESPSSSGTSVKPRAPSASLAASLGTTASVRALRNPLGTQLGIRSDKAHSASDSVPSLSTASRPARLSSAKRSTSYESTGSTESSAGYVDARASRRPSARFFETKQDEEHAASQTCAGHEDKENLMTGNVENALDAKVQWSPSPPADTARNHHHQHQHHQNNSQSSRGGPLHVVELDHPVYRRASSGLDKETTETELIRRSSDEGSGITKRRPLRESESPHRQKQDKQATASVAPPSAVADRATFSTSAQYQTPSMSTAARGLRSGQGAKIAGAPWSVGRAIKRIDRHTGLDKPPQRIFAQQQADDDDEDEEHHTNDAVSLQKPPSPIAEEFDGSRESRNARHLERAGTTQADAMQPAQRDRLSESKHRESAPLHRTLQVPLGADEDEDEEENEQHPQVTMRDARRAGSSHPAEPQAHQRRRAAMSDIMSAKVPQGASNGARRVPPLQGPGNSIAGQSQQAAAWPAECMTESDLPPSPSDFMTLVRQEAGRQKGASFLQQLSAKPSKDLETKVRKRDVPCCHDRGHS